MPGNWQTISVIIYYLQQSIRKLVLTFEALHQGAVKSISILFVNVIGNLLQVSKVLR
jgi:hypothetical protein